MLGNLDDGDVDDNDGGDNDDNDDGNDDDNDGGDGERTWQVCVSRGRGGFRRVCDAESYQRVINTVPYLIFVIFFTLAKFLENKIYTEKTRKLRQNTQ